MEDLVFNGIVLPPVIMAVVELLKRVFYLKPKHVPIATAILAVLAYGAIQVAMTNQEFALGFEYLLNALIIALSSSGLYSVGKTYTKK